MSISNPSGAVFTASDSNSNEAGFYVNANHDCEVEAIVIDSGGVGTSAKIVDSSKTLISSASFSGDTATFASPVALTSGSNYYIVVRASSRRYGTKSAFPRVRTDITYTNTAYATTGGNLSTLITGIGEDCNIADILTVGSATATRNPLFAFGGI